MVTEIEETKKVPGFLYGLLLILIYAFISALLGPVLIKLSIMNPLFDKWKLFIGFVVSFGLIMPLAFVMFRIKNLDYNNIPLKHYLILIPGTIALLVVTESIVNRIPMSEKWEQIFAQAIQFNLPGFLSVAIAAPILEEIIFRGIVLKGFLRKYNPQKAIIYSALLFGIAHMNPWQFIAAFAIGYVMGWMYWKSKSILPGLFIHFVNNTFSFAIGYKYQDINTTIEDICGGIIPYLSILLVCIITVVVIVRYFVKEYCKS